MKNYFIIFLFSLTFVVLSACKDEQNTPDVSNVKVAISPRRLDTDISEIDTNSIADGIRTLKLKYPDFLDFYLDTLMNFNIRSRYDDTVLGIREGLRTFLTYKDYRGLFDTVRQHFPDTRMIDDELTKGFQYYKYYYPEATVPKVIYFVSGLQRWSAITVDTTILAIGLDMYLGPEYPYYASVGIPAYMTAQLAPQYAARNAFAAIYQNDHPFVMDGQNLLSMMIQRGKEQYFLSKVLPFTHDTTRLAYTQAQLNWCRENEAMVYSFFSKDELLYETNWQRILRYVNDGPNATGMPAESPGNVGTFIGLQIVKSWLKQHPESTMQTLFADKSDASKFLQESAYKPK